MGGRALGILIAALALAAPAQAAVERGGKVTYLSFGDIDFLDPGATYYSFGFMVQLAVNRPLYSHKPGRSGPVPDLAEGPPVISDGGRTLTVRIKDGVRYAPPVDREVRSDDVRYAIERGFSRSVANGYAPAYFGDIEGAPRGYSATPRRISGIETPDRRTLVLRLERPIAATVAQALVMPITVPVPRDHAARFDRRVPSTYERHVAFTGPYRVAQRRIDRFTHLTRNPNWDPATDHRPAHLDRIDIEAGARDVERTTRRAKRGRRLLCCDGESRRVRPTASISSGGARWVALNTTVKPLDRLNVRRAIVAAADRRKLARGRSGPIADHFLPPGMPGFAESDFRFDFLARERGSLRLARRYLRKAKVRPRRFKPLLVVGDAAEPDRSTTIYTAKLLRRLGFRTRLKLVARDVMFTRYCNYPRSNTAVCPSIGWSRDFDDPYSMLALTFGGDNIQPVGNSNWSELSVPAIDRAMDEGATIAPGPARNRAWAKINRQITAQAPGIPYIWDTQGQYASKDLSARMNPYTALWDLNYTGIRSSSSSRTNIAVTSAR